MSHLDAIARAEARAQGFDLGQADVRPTPSSPIEAQARIIFDLMGGPSIFSNAILAHPDTKRTDLINHLLEVFRLTRKHSFLALGDVGCGKTFSLLAYMVDLMHRSNTRSGRFITAYDVAHLIQGKKTDELDRLIKVKFLLIDDLGTEPSGWKGSDFLAHFENLLIKRHTAMKHTFMTTNLTWARADENGPPGFKELYGERITSRLREDAEVYESPGKDLRTR